MARRIRASCRKQYGDGPLPFEVELSPAGVAFAQPGTKGCYPWADVSVIQETADTFEIYTRQGGFVHVRKRGIGAAEAAARFLAEATRYLAESRNDAGG